MNSNTPKERGGPEEKELTPLELLRKGYEDGQGKDNNNQDSKHSAIPLKDGSGKPTNPLYLLMQGYAEKVKHD